MHCSTIFTFIFLGLPCLGISGPVCSYPDLKSALTSTNNRWSNRTVISFPGDEHFANVTERWTVYKPPTYLASISPADEADVAKVVKLAKLCKTPFLATGGRHGYGIELGRLQNGLALDLSQLNQVVVDSQAAAVTVGGGARFRDIYNPIWDAGFELQTGTCSCPGVMGVSIGGGIGRLQGVYGLMIDALVSARVVTAQGDVLDVSKNSHPDLFWGIRGAGANFGVLVQATYKLQPNPSRQTFTSIDVIFTADKNVSYFNLLQAMIHQNDSSPGLMPRLSVSSSMSYNSTTDQPVIVANWVYKGPRAEALQIVAPMLNLGPVVSVVQDVPWNELSTVAGFGSDAAECIPGQMNDLYSVNLRNFNAASLVSAFSKMATFWAQYPDAQDSTVLVECFPGGAVGQVSNTATAYPWRETVSYILLQFTWSGGSSGASSGPANAMGAALRSDLAASSGYPRLSVYVNYAHGDESVDTIYGVNLPRLTGLKRTWDPDNIFAYNMVLPA